MSFDLIAIGNPVYDEITTPYISTEGRVLSGCSTNAALVAKKLNVQKVGLIGSIGKDYYRKFIEDLSSFGVEPLDIIIGEQTGGFKLTYFENGDRTLDILGIANKINFDQLSDLTINHLKKAKFILLGPILQEVDGDFISTIKEITEAKLFLDPQGLLRRVNSENRIERVADKNTLRNIIEKVDFVKPNEYEAEVITGYKDPVKAAETLKSWNNKVAIVTLGEHGSVISFGSETYDIPPYRTFAKDPTGAGDSYAGSFIAKQLQVDDLIESALFASAASSIMVEYTGPSFEMSVEKVNKRLVELKKIFKLH
ncbi:MAG: carbohydrate kinase family protein [Candidatus Odinarchaeia archaeon]